MGTWFESKSHFISLFLSTNTAEFPLLTWLLLLEFYTQVNLNHINIPCWVFQDYVPLIWMHCARRHKEGT